MESTSATIAPNLTGLRLYLRPLKYYRYSRIENFRPKLRFSFVSGNFTIKTAQTSDELREALELRHQIFLEEGLGKTDSLRLDFDKFDLQADHILLIDNDIGKIIGTYRIMSSDHITKGFYSSVEFTTEKFLNIPGLKLELGRACIHPDYRKGYAIHLIWKGLGRYASITNADYMFGCTSIKIQNKSAVSNMLESLNHAYCKESFEIRPNSKYRYNIEKKLETPIDDYNSLVPVLLKSYIKAGAKVYGLPAYDRDFRCFDVFTCLNLKKLPPKYIKKFLES